MSIVFFLADRRVVRHVALTIAGTGQLDLYDLRLFVDSSVVLLFVSMLVACCTIIVSFCYALIQFSVLPLGLF